MSKLCSSLVLLLSSLNPTTPIPASNDRPYAQVLLLWAAKEGHLAIVEHILQHHDVNPNIRNKRGQPPLFLAASRGHKTVCQLLLDNRADRNVAESFMYQTPLSVAAGNSHEETAHLLVERGANIESKDINGQTPLSRAAEAGHKGIVALLIKEGADINTSDAYKGQRPLSWAAAGGFSPVVRMLLDAGARLDGGDDETRMTALSWAARNGHCDTVSLLVAAGADVCSYDSDHRAALGFAAGHGHGRIVEFLVEAGSEVHPPTFSILGDFRPLQWARRAGHTKIVKLLEEKQPKTTHSETKPMPPASDKDSKPLILQTQQPHIQHFDAITSSSLCNGCSNLDFAKYFTQSVHKAQPNSTPRAHNDAIQLGAVSDLVQRSRYCPFCHLVSEALCLRWSKYRNVTPQDIAGERNVFVSIYSYTSANHGQGGFNELTPTPSAAYSIGLQTSRARGSDRPWPPLLEGQIALVAKDAQRLGQHCFGQARVVADGQVNRELLKTWLNECEHHHGRGCQLERSSSHVEGFLLVDTTLMCIVEAPPQCRYVALSYCWGPAAVMKLVIANKDQLEKQHGLKGVWDKVPRTIQDAVDLCRELGERYLWIDSLCIVQDDPIMRGAQISRMDLIYQQAVLTLVAADGTHANAGIPGVQPGSRPSKQVIRKVGDMTMAVRFNYVDDVVDTETWNTRAWTYQERCLSKRLLFMTSTQAYFICNEKVFCEDMITECETRTFFLDTIYWRPMRVPRGLNSVQVSEDARNLALTYSHHLREFTKRQMTWQSDALNAVSAVLNATISQLDTRLWQGLPEMIFDKGLLWIPNTVTQRRKVPGDCKDIPTPVFASWSWTGWAGSVLNETLQFGAGHSFQPLVDWHLMNEKRQAISLEPQALVMEYNIVEPPAYFAYSPKIDRPVPDRFPHTHIIPNSRLDKTDDWRYAPYLLGWTVVARFKIQEFDHKPAVDIWPKGPSSFQVISKQGRSVGKVSLDCSLQLDRSGQLEFIMLSRVYWPSRLLGSSISHLKAREKLTSKKGPWSLMNVMLIQRFGEFSERRGVGFIDEDAWEASGPVAEFIVLR